jgi:hypothetical protein
MLAKAASGSPKNITPKREGIEQTSFEIVRLCVHLSEGHRQARIRAQAMERDLKHRGRNINADDGASRSYPVSESQRGLTATTANVENLLALGRLQRVYGRKSPGRRSGGRATRETAPRSCQLPRSSVRFVRRSPWASGFRHVNVLARKFNALRSVSYRRTLSGVSRIGEHYIERLDRTAEDFLREHQHVGPLDFTGPLSARSFLALSRETAP